MKRKDQLDAVQSGSRLAEYVWGSLQPTIMFENPFFISDDISPLMQCKHWLEHAKAAYHEMGHFTQDLFSAFGCLTYSLVEEFLNPLPDVCPVEAEGTIKIPVASLVRAMQRDCLLTKQSEIWFASDESSKQKLTYQLGTINVLEADAMNTTHDSLRYPALLGGMPGTPEEQKAVLEDELRSAIYPEPYMVFRNIFRQFTQGTPDHWIDLEGQQSTVLDRPGFDVGLIMCMPQSSGQPLVVDCTQRALQGAYAPSKNDAIGACCTSQCR